MARVLTLALPLSLVATFAWEGTAWPRTPPFTTGHGLSTCQISGYMTFDPPLNAHASFLSQSSVRHTARLTNCVGPNTTQFGQTITGGTQRTVGRLGKVRTNCSTPLVLGGDFTATASGPDSKIRTKWTHTGSERIPDTIATSANTKVVWTWTDGSANVISLNATDAYSTSGVSRVRGSFRRSIFPTPENRDWPAFRSSLQGSLTLAQVRARCLSTNPAQNIAREAYSGSISMP